MIYQRHGELKTFFRLYLLNNDISLVILVSVLRLYVCVPKVLLEGIVSRPYFLFCDKKNPDNFWSFPESSFYRFNKTKNKDT